MIRAKTCRPESLAWRWVLLLLATALLHPGVAWGQLRLNPTLSRVAEPIRAVWAPVVADAAAATVRIRVDGKVVALGTIVSPDGLIATKASELTSRPQVELSDGRRFDAKLLGAVGEHDLAVLQIEAEGLPFVTLPAERVEPEVGRFVATVGSGELPVALGVISVPRRRIGNQGMLGVTLEDARGVVGARVGSVLPASAAARAGIEPQDVVVEIDQQPVGSREDLQLRLGELPPGQTVRLLVRRGERELPIEVTLMPKPREQSPRASVQNRMGGPLSARASDFPQVLQHDTVLAPDQCGSPLVALDGTVLGINIARAGRVESYALPADVIAELLPRVRAGEFPVVYAEASRQ